MWSAEEKDQLRLLYTTIDVDGSGSISRAELIEIAGLAEIKRDALGHAFDAAVASSRAKCARTPGGSSEIRLAQFVKLVDGLSDANKAAIRAILPGLAAAGTDKKKLLVFDDGKQQLWRLVPGGRALVRKPSSMGRSL